MEIFKKLIYLLHPRDRKKVNLLMVMITIMAIMQMTGVASIIPFIAVISNSEVIETNSILKSMFQTSQLFGVENKQQFIFVLGFVFFIILVVSIFFSVLTLYMQKRFTHMCEHSISKTLMENYLSQSFTWFLSRNSVDIIKNILSEVSGVVGKGLQPMIVLLSQSFIVIAIIILLILVNPKLAMIVGFALSLFYFLVYKFTRKFLKVSGEERFKANELRYVNVNEAFNAVKLLKLDGLEKIYIDRYSDASLKYAESSTRAAFLSLLPRFIIDIFAFGGMILIILISVWNNNNNLDNILPIIAVYAFAGYRLIPAIQSIYLSVAQIRFISPAINALYFEYKNLKKNDLSQEKKLLPFKKDIVLKNITYQYPGASQPVLQNVNLTILNKSTIGLIGSTGGGKTTTVDIILGLLETQAGTLEIDGEVITKNNLRAWQNVIGYVPQQIYLTDSTIATNIAFGQNSEKIDQKALERASKIANLHDFVINELPKKYQTTVGERGVRLSGGQIQRIAIARALYNNPRLLILDEATNALDNQTEKAVIDAIDNIGKEITIIMIAHRLNTLKRCDKIYKIEKNSLVSGGTYEQLIQPKI